MFNHKESGANINLIKRECFNIRCIVIFCLIFLLILIVSSLQAQTGTTVPELVQLDSSIISFMKKWNIKEGTAALVKNERLVYARAFGNDSLNQQTQPSDLFRIASLSKPITAIAIMKLVEEGKIKLEDQVFGTNGLLNDMQYLKIIDERILDITVRDLLQHTAGWDRDNSPDNDPMFNTEHIAEIMHSKMPVDNITIIRYMLQKKLDFTPGSDYAYSNLGYAILGRIIEKESGVSYEQFVKVNVLYPLEIFDMQLAKNNTASSSDSINNKSYNFFNGHYINPCSGINLEAMDANGGWMATASDLAKLLVATDGSHTFPDVLSSYSIEVMTTPSKQNPSYGLGWFVNAKGNYWHTGSLKGTAAFMARLKNGMVGVLILSDRVESKKFFSELDKLLWDGVKDVTYWPTTDLFQRSNVVQNSSTQKYLNTH